MTDREYTYLSQKIRELLNIDLAAYKSGQMRRRLNTFVQREGDTNVVVFCKRLERDAEQLSALRDMLTINVSEFFRDRTQFDYLKSHALPELLSKRARLSLWTAACSNGQEPYSVAILLDEMTPGRGHRILATDIDPQALRRAKAGGPYVASDLRNVTKDQLRRYFNQTDEGYAVNDSLRRRVTFQEHNLLADDFPNGFDLVLCRNVMIYFSAEAKEQLFHRFSEALRPGGILFVGATESLIGSETYNFARLLANFYRKQDDTGAAGKEQIAA